MEIIPVKIVKLINFMQDKNRQLRPAGFNQSR